MTQKNKNQIIEIIKLIIIIILVLSLIIINVKAEPIVYNEDSEVNGNTVCANQKYTINDSAQIAEDSYVLITDENMNVLKTFQNNNANISFVMPDGISNAIITQIAIDESGNLTDKILNTVPLTINDCGNEKIEDKYKTDVLTSKINVNNNKLSFTEPTNKDISNYKLTYQKINDIRSIQYNFEKNKEIEIPKNKIIQIKEEYTLNGKKESNYFEVNFVGEKYFVRSVDTFDVKQIDLSKIIDKKDFLILFILIIIFFILGRSKKRIKKRIRKQKQTKIKLTQQQLKNKEISSQETRRRRRG